MRISLLFCLLISGQVFAQSLKATTFNVGLAHTFVPLAEERLEPLKKSLAQYDSDILCLQEVWRKKDQKALTEVLKDRYPYSFVTKIKNYRQGPRPTCRIKEIFGEGKFVSCMQKQCGDSEGDEFTDCIIERCGGALEDLKRNNRNCASALMAQVGKSPVASILTLLNPLWRAGLFAYKGSNGLMLFSKHPLKKKEYIDLKEISTLNRRGALQARIEIDGKSLDVMCTHISADLTNTAPYTGPYQSWGQENAAQLKKLLDISRHSVLPKVFMGDFNCGFEDPIASISPELSASCQQVLDAGFSDPLSTSARECTFCQDNFLNDGEDSSVAIDHIFLKYLRPLRDEVVFKAPLLLQTEGGLVKTNLSDHYGYEVEFEFP